MEHSAGGTLIGVGHGVGGMLIGMGRSAGGTSVGVECKLIGDPGST